MPTYTLSYSNIKLNSKKKSNIAKAITKTHKQVTAANTYFAQVIFNNIEKNSHFMGGVQTTKPQIFLHGQIRSGRSISIKEKLITNLRNTLIKVSKLDKSQIWIYIVDLIPNQMIEYGEILPESGKEKFWFSKLSPKLKKQLKSLEKKLITDKV